MRQYVDRQSALDNLPSLSRAENALGLPVTTDYNLSEPCDACHHPCERTYLATDRASIHWNLCADCYDRAKPPR